MKQTRTQRYHHHHQAFYQRNSFWLICALGLLLAVFFVAPRLQTPAPKQETAVKPATKSAVSTSKKSPKTSAKTATFNQNIYQTNRFRLTLTGGKIISDSKDQPVLLIEYQFHNESKTSQKPVDIWSSYIGLKQGKHKLSATKSLATDLGEADKTAVANSKLAVTAGSSQQAAMAYTLSNKDTIRLTPLDLKTKLPLGHKDYELTE